MYNKSYTTNFGKVSVVHTGRGLQVSIAAADRSSPESQRMGEGSTQCGSRRVGVARRS